MAFEVVELEVLKHPVVLRRLRRVRQRVHTRLAPLTGTIATSPEPVPFADRLELPTRPVRRGTLWGTAPGCAWFHLEAPLPPGDDVALVLDLDGEGMVLDRAGAAVAAVTSRLTPLERHGAARGKTRVDLTPALLDRIAPDGRVELWVDAGFNGKLVPPLGLARVRDLGVVRVDRRVEAYYYDLLTASYAWVATKDPALAAALAAAEAAFDRGDLPGARAALGSATAGRDTSPGRQPDGEGVTATAVGHGHLDMAWLWPVRETRRKARRTLQVQLDQMDTHPDHTYGISQPQQVAWVERDDPELFERLRAAVAAGRVELQGGFWVEPDTNLPSGESLVRQAVRGQRYWQSRFGRRVDFCWLPDAFGYSAALPQILRGAGMRSFSTIKLAWNEHNDFPHRSFVWVGHDGSEVLVHMPPEGSYNSSASGPALAALARQYPEAEVAPEALLIYGSGDGGGGPGPAHLEVLDRSAHLPGLPRVEHGTVGGFFERLDRYRESLPRWPGELYLEKHQGTLTTQAATKRWNRLIEHRLHDVELLAALAWWRGERQWPQELLEQVWDDVLLFQFHDMLPGSSIARVHRECEERYAEIDALLRAELSALVGEGDNPRSVVSTSPVRRRGFVDVDGTWHGYDVAPFATAPLTPWSGDEVELTAAGMANDRISVTVSADGSISSLVDRASGREHAGPWLGRLVLHRDRWSYFDAWDIDEGWLDRDGSPLTVRSHETLRDGPRAIHRLVYEIGKSRVEQDIVLEPGAAFVLVELRVDWHERHKMLRVHFSPTARADEVACEIQHGHIRRSTREDTPQERAQTEICAHRWIDVSSPEGHGLAVVNDSKYGHRAKGGELSLNLLRAPVYPDPHADRGRHVIRYAMHPHEGGLADSEVFEVAAALNDPLLLGPVDAAGPLFVVSDPAVVLDTVTRSADGRALVLRLYESLGQARTISLGLPGLGEIGQVRATDLLEDDLAPVDLGALTFGPFELRTLRVERP